MVRSKVQLPPDHRKNFGGLLCVRKPPQNLRSPTSEKEKVFARGRVDVGSQLLLASWLHQEGVPFNLDLVEDLSFNLGGLLPRRKAFLMQNYNE